MGLLKATSKVLVRTHSRQCPSWPHRKQGHGSDTNGNLWGCPLCCRRNKCRMEKEQSVSTLPGQL